MLDGKRVAGVCTGTLPLGQEYTKGTWTATQRRTGLPLPQHGCVKTAPWATTDTLQVAKRKRPDADYTASHAWMV